MERSFIEICGFERETLHRFREVTINLGKVIHTVFSFVFVSFTFINFCFARGVWVKTY